MGRLKIAIVGAGTGRGQSWMQTMAKLSEPDDLYDFCGLCEVLPEIARPSVDPVVRLWYILHKSAATCHEMNSVSKA